MVSLEVVAILLSGISISASLFYYANVLQNANKTRQAQLYMGILNTFRSTEFQSQFHIAESATWKDMEDYREKYSPENNTEVLTAVTSMFVFYDSLCSLVKKELIDIDFVDGLLAISLIMIWRRFEPVLMDDREFFQAPTIWEEFEYVYNEIIKKPQYSATRSPHITEPSKP